MERLDAGSPTSLARAVDVLRSGGIVAYPTDTLYGLAVDPRRDDAVERLFAVKGRAQGVAVPLVAGGIVQAAQAGELGPRERQLAQAFWPGPLSIVVPAHAAVSRLALGGRETVAVRVPAQPVARALASAFGFCITATSANPSGHTAPASAELIDARLLGLIDLLLDAGPAPGGEPSTLVTFDASGPVLIRSGAVAWERVLKSLG